MELIHENIDHRNKLTLAPYGDRESKIYNIIDIHFSPDSISLLNFDGLIEGSFHFVKYRKQKDYQIYCDNKYLFVLRIENDNQKLIGRRLNTRTQDVMIFSLMTGKVINHQDR